MTLDCDSVTSPVCANQDLGSWRTFGCAFLGLLCTFSRLLAFLEQAQRHSVTTRHNMPKHDTFMTLDCDSVTSPVCANQDLGSWRTFGCAFLGLLCTFSRLLAFLEQAQRHSEKST